MILNLIFFFAFSMAVEQLIGSFLYLAFFALCCITTAITYAYDLLGEPGTLPTIGLSGVVSGLIAFVAVIFPTKTVSVFYWILLFVGKVNIPIIIVVGFYILSDLYGLQYLTDESEINHISHLSGSITGAFCAILYWIIKGKEDNYKGD